MKNTKQRKLPGRRIGMGAGAGLMTVVILSAVSAWMVDRGWMDIGYMDLASAGILVLSGLVSALAAGRAGEPLVPLASAGCVLLGLMCLNLVLFDGDLKGLLPCSLAYMGGVGAGMMMTMGIRRKTPQYRPGRGKYR